MTNTMEINIDIDVTYCVDETIDIENAEEILEAIRLKIEDNLQRMEQENQTERDLDEYEAYLDHLESTYGGL